jgi:hypothetical protein
MRRVKWREVKINFYTVFSLDEVARSFLLKEQAYPPIFSKSHSLQMQAIIMGPANQKHTIPICSASNEVRYPQNPSNNPTST